jgi:hypothetical protein
MINGTALANEAYNWQQLTSSQYCFKEEIVDVIVGQWCFEADRAER